MARGGAKSVGDSLQRRDIRQISREWPAGFARGPFLRQPRPHPRAQPYGSMLKAGTTNITLTEISTAISNALTACVKAYNATTTAIDAHRGTGGGALAGQSIVNTLAQSMREIANYPGTGSLTTMPASDSRSTITASSSLDTTVFKAAAGKDIESVTAFLGGATGMGF